MRPFSHYPCGELEPAPRRRARASASAASASSNERAGRAGTRVQRGGADRGDVGEPDCAVEEGGHRDFVGGVEDRRRGAAGGKRLDRQAARPGSARSRAPRSRVRPACASSSGGTPDSMRSGNASAWAIGVRMSGCPSSASTEPSTYSTSEWMTLCGWITTSMAAAGTPNSQCASMTSRPLFIIVAESTEILRPIRQFGMRAGLVGRDVRQFGERARAKRTAGSREQQAANAGAAGIAVIRRAAGTGRSRCVRCRSAAAWRRPPAPRA